MLVRGCLLFLPASSPSLLSDPTLPPTHSALHPCRTPRLHTLSRPHLPILTQLRGSFVTDVFATVESNNGTSVCAEFSPNASPTPIVYGTLGGRPPVRLLAGAPLIFDGITLSVVKQGDA